MLALNAAGRLPAVSSSSEPEVAMASCQEGQAESGRGQSMPPQNRRKNNNALLAFMAALRPGYLITPPRLVKTTAP
jgi:hypothetical protein